MGALTVDPALERANERKEEGLSVQTFYWRQRAVMMSVPLFVVTIAFALFHAPTHWLVFGILASVAAVVLALTTNCSVSGSGVTVRNSFALRDHQYIPCSDFDHCERVVDGGGAMRLLIHTKSGRSVEVAAVEAHNPYERWYQGRFERILLKTCAGR